MRTTVNIDDQLLAAIKHRADEEHRTIGAVLEDAIRRFLAREEARVDIAWALPEVHYEGGLLPGVDLYDKEQIADLTGMPTNAAV